MTTIEQAVRATLRRAADDLAQFDPSVDEYVVCGLNCDDHTVGLRDDVTRFEFRTIPTVYPMTAAVAMAQRWNAAHATLHPVTVIRAREWRAGRLCRLADLLAMEAA